MSILYDANTVATAVSAGLLHAWRKGGAVARVLVIVAVTAVTVTITTLLLEFALDLDHPAFTAVAAIAGVIGGVLSFGFAAYQQTIEEAARDEVIQRVQAHALEHPEEPKAAWELARVKLESYLRRNLSQIRWIFGLTLLVMLAGFAIIVYGITRIYQDPANFQPSIVVTASGLIVEFVAASFLVIYKSTMEQARDYVNILERINAVGMSVQIIENIEGSQVELRDKTRAEVALALLSLYGALQGKQH